MKIRYSCSSPLPRSIPARITLGKFTVARKSAIATLSSELHSKVYKRLTGLVVLPNSMLLLVFVKKANGQMPP